MLKLLIRKIIPKVIILKVADKRHVMVCDSKQSMCNLQVKNKFVMRFHVSVDAMLHKLGKEIDDVDAKKETRYQLLFEFPITRCILSFFFYNCVISYCMIPYRMELTKEQVCLLGIPCHCYIVHMHDAPI